jgi:hypothetical protein
VNDEATQAVPAAALRQHWPAAAGLGFAALVGYGITSGVELASVLAAAALVYLGAAALQRPMAAWPLFFATAVVITIARLTDAPLDPTWLILAGAVILLGWGLVRGAVRPRYGLPLQSLALLVFGALAAAALLVNPTVGALLVAAGLLGHAGWDLHHYRTRRVVARSLAEFCIVLDAALAVLIVVITLWS